MGKWKCNLCSYVYDDAKEPQPFEDLPEDWVCPVCNIPGSRFIEIA